jgi:Na+(H+)/acetate symporter ActP
MPPIGFTIPGIPSEAQTVITAVSILLLIVAIIGFISKLGGMALSLGKWVLLGLLVLVMVWGLYNTLGARLGLWEPLSLDRWLKPVTEPLNAAANWLWEKFVSLLGGLRR